ELHEQPAGPREDTDRCRCARCVWSAWPRRERAEIGGSRAPPQSRQETRRMPLTEATRAPLSEKRPCHRDMSSLRGRLRRVHIARQRLLGGLDERGEGGRLVDGQLCQHAAVDLNAGKAKTLNEPVVGDAVLACSSVDALDPQ